MNTLLKRTLITVAAVLATCLVRVSPALAQELVEVRDFTAFTNALTDSEAKDVKIRVMQDIVRPSDSQGLNTINVPAGKKIELEGPGKVQGFAGGETKIVFTGSEISIGQIDMTGVRINFTGGSTAQVNGLSMHDNTFAAPVLFIQNSNLSFEDGEIYNNTVNNSAGVAYSPISVVSDSHFVMNKGSIHNNKVSNADNSLEAPALGGAMLVQASMVAINGGSFDSNTASDISYGGAICTFGGDLTIKGGTFINNSAYRGGALAAYLTGNLRITGGEFRGNHAVNVGGNKDARGGAVYFGNYKLKDDAASAYFTYFFGTTVQNTAENIISGGSFLNNTSEAYGGAIYVETASFAYTNSSTGEEYTTDSLSTVGLISIRELLKPDDPNSNLKSSKLTLYNALVYNNSVSHVGSIKQVEGGGLYLCPTSKATFNLTKGIALIANEANPANPSDASAADLSIHNARETHFMASNTMLGGAANVLYYDGGTESVDGKVMEAKRFDPANPGNPLPNMTELNLHSALALKNQPSDDALSLARRMATTTFEGNTAYWGGAIAVNGALTIGTTDLPYQLKVKAIFADGSESKDFKGAVTIGGLAAQPFNLNSENSFTIDPLATIPDPKTIVDKDGKLLEITALAYDMNDYDIRVEKVQDDEERTLSFILHLSKRLTPPEDPKAETSTDPKPVQPKPEVKKNILPKTSDLFSPQLVFPVLIIAGVVIAVALYFKKKY